MLPSSRHNSLINHAIMNTEYYVEVDLERIINGTSVLFQTKGNNWVYAKNVVFGEAYLLELPSMWKIINLPLSLCTKS